MKRNFILLARGWPRAIRLSTFHTPRVYTRRRAFLRARKSTHSLLRNDKAIVYRLMDYCARHISFLPARAFAAFRADKTTVGRVCKPKSRG